MTVEHKKNTLKGLTLTVLIIITLFLIVTFITGYVLYLAWGIKSILLSFIYEPIYTLIAMIKTPRKEIREYYKNEITNEEKRMLQISSLSICIFLLPLISLFYFLIALLTLNLGPVIIGLGPLISQFIGMFMVQSENLVKTLQSFLARKEKEEDEKIASGTYAQSGFTLLIALIFISMIVSFIK